MIKIYVSLPISGLDMNERKATAAHASERIRSMYEEPVEVITPFDVCKDAHMSYNECMGRDIEALLDCDIIYLLPNWEHSRGCMAEIHVANIYNKKIMLYNEGKTIKKSV